MSDEFTSCEDCDRYLKPEYEGDWQCIQSDCPHHITIVEQFKKRVKTTS